MEKILKKTQEGHKTKTFRGVYGPRPLSVQSNPGWKKLPSFWLFLPFLLFAPPLLSWTGEGLLGERLGCASLFAGNFPLGPESTGESLRSENLGQDESGQGGDQESRDWEQDPAFRFLENIIKFTDLKERKQLRGEEEDPNFFVKIQIQNFLDQYSDDSAGKIENMREELMTIVRLKKEFLDIFMSLGAVKENGFQLELQKYSSALDLEPPPTSQEPKGLGKAWFSFGRKRKSSPKQSPRREPNWGLLQLQKDFAEKKTTLKAFLQGMQNLIRILEELSPWAEDKFAQAKGEFSGLESLFRYMEALRGGDFQLGENHDFQEVFLPSVKYYRDEAFNKVKLYESQVEKFEKNIRIFKELKKYFADWIRKFNSQHDLIINWLQKSQQELLRLKIEGSLPQSESHWGDVKGLESLKNQKAKLQSSLEEGSSFLGENPLIQQDIQEEIMEVLEDLREFVLVF